MWGVLGRNTLTRVRVIPGHPRLGVPDGGLRNNMNCRDQPSTDSQCRITSTNPSDSRVRLASRFNVCTCIGHTGENFRIVVECDENLHDATLPKTLPFVGSHRTRDAFPTRVVYTYRLVCQLTFDENQSFL
jgi:hypothetical protein